MKLKELKEATEQQLDESVLQSVFNYLWIATGKALDSLPMIGDQRKEKRILKDYERFVAKMDIPGTKKFLAELTSKLKSSHHATVKASERHITILNGQIAKVKSSENAKQYVSNMKNMRVTLKRFERFIAKSNKGAADRKRTKRHANK